MTGHAADRHSHSVQVAAVTGLGRDLLGQGDGAMVICRAVAWAKLPATILPAAAGTQAAVARHRAITTGIQPAATAMAAAAGTAVDAAALRQTPATATVVARHHARVRLVAHGMHTAEAPRLRAALSQTFPYAAVTLAVRFRAAARARLRRPRP